MCGWGFSRWKCMWKAFREVRPAQAKAWCPDSVNEELDTCKAFRKMKYQVCNTHFYIQPSQLPGDAKEADSCTQRMERLERTCFVEEMFWSGVLGAELAFRSLIWEVRAHGPEGAGSGGREPGAVMPPASHPGKVIPLFEIKLMLIKTEL